MRPGRRGGAAATGAAFLRNRHIHVGDAGPTDLLGRVHDFQVRDWTTRLGWRERCTEARQDAGVDVVHDRGELPGWFGVVVHETPDRTGAVQSCALIGCLDASPASERIKEARLESAPLRLYSSSTRVSRHGAPRRGVGVSCTSGLGLWSMHPTGCRGSDGRVWTCSTAFMSHTDPALCSGGMRRIALRWGLFSFLEPFPFKHGECRCTLAVLSERAARQAVAFVRAVALTHGTLAQCRVARRVTPKSRKVATHQTASGNLLREEAVAVGACMSASISALGDGDQCRPAAMRLKRDY